jgi:hypothetical protein
MWCNVQRMAYRGAEGDMHRVTPRQIEVHTSEAVRDSADWFGWQRLKATGFDFTTGPGSGN